MSSERPPSGSPVLEVRGRMIDRSPLSDLEGDIAKRANVMSMGSGWKFEERQRLLIESWLDVAIQP